MAAESYPAIPSTRTALTMRCPRCGRGRLFAGFLTVAQRCGTCGLDLQAHDSGDGPAVFLILGLGALVVPLALIVEVNFTPPLWLHMVLWPPLIIGLAIGALRPLKAFFVAQQFRHRSTGEDRGYG